MGQKNPGFSKSVTLIAQEICPLADVIVSWIKPVVLVMFGSYCRFVAVVECCICLCGSAGLKCSLHGPRRDCQILWSSCISSHNLPVVLLGETGSVCEGVLNKPPQRQNMPFLSVIIPLINKAIKSGSSRRAFQSTEWLLTDSASWLFPSFSSHAASCGITLHIFIYLERYLNLKFRTLWFQKPWVDQLILPLTVKFACFLFLKCSLLCTFCQPAS